MKFVILLVVCLILPTAGLQCAKKIDLAFVIDSSNSIWRPNFELQKTFVQQIVKLYDVSPDQTRVAALTFGHEVDYAFNFNDYHTVDDVVARIGRIPHSMGVSTHTYSALAGMREHLFSQRNGSRPDVEHICIVLTDGASSDKFRTISEANLAKQAGIELFAIGIGNSTNIEELEEMVSFAFFDHLFTVPSFGALDKDIFRKNILSATCNEIRTTTEAVTTTRRVIVIPEQPTVCRGKEADIVFIVDRSSSIWIEDFKTQLRFLADVISQFDVSTGNTQVSLITFSDTATVEFHLNRYSNVQQMKSAILSVKTEGGITNTHLALETMLTDVFTVKNGYRPGVAHICIVITDGGSTYPTLTQQMSMLVHDADVITFAIGVGDKRDVEELKLIASAPSSRHVFEVDGYQALPEIKQIITDRTCEVPTNIIVEPPGCQGKEADIVFIVDRSSSIWLEDFKTQTKFLADVISQFDIASGNTQVSLITFSDTAEVEFYLKRYDSVEQMRSAILSIQSKGGITNTHLALEIMLTDVFTVKNGYRPGVAHICIVITDGASTYPTLTRQMSQQTHSAGIITFAIGVGDDRDVEELKLIASEPFSRHVFEVDGYQALPEIKQIITDRTCGVPTKIIEKPGCQGKEADIVFIVDRSSSIWLEDFKTQTKFLADVISQFDIASGNTQVSLITFSDTAEVEFYLKRYDSVEQMRSAILSVQSKGGITNTHLALEIMLTDVFTVKNGYRPGVAHICIVITDGASTYPTLTRQMSQQTHSAGIITFAIGVGDDRDVEELKLIASEPFSRHVFEVDGYQALPEIKQIITDRTCGVPTKIIEKPGCQGKEADIVFIVDRSSSIWLEDFKTQTKFLADVISQFDIASGNTQVSLITFSDTAEVEFYLKRYDSVEQMRSAILSVQSKGGITNTHLALETMLTDVFTVNNGYRPGVAHICIVITDGASTYPTLTRQMSQQTHSAGIITFAIGVGDDRDVEELKLIASEPFSRHVFEVDGYQALPEIKQIITDRTCGVPTKIIEKPGCQGKEADIVFIVDRSSSIWLEDFKTQMKFLADVISQFDIASGNTQVSLITFSDTAEVEFYLKRYDSVEQMRSAILSVQSKGGITNTHLALETMLTDVFTVKNGYRPGVAHICIVITDGASTYPTLTRQMSQQTHSAGIITFAIGVGDDRDVEELKLIASQPFSRHVFEVDGYQALPQIKQIITDRTCGVPSKIEKYTPAPEIEVPEITRCEKAVDLAFVIDGSTSIWRPDFALQIKFVQQIVKLFNVSPDQTRVAALTFGHEVDYEFNFNDYNTVDDVVARIGKIPHSMGVSTHTYSALAGMREHLFSQRNGSRPDVEHICIVFTDGASSDKFKTISEANLAKQTGIELFAIGIGNNTNRQELEEMVSSPKDYHLFVVPSYGSLDTQVFRQEILDATCNDVIRTRSTRAPRPTTTTAIYQPRPVPTEINVPLSIPIECQNKEADIVFIVDNSGSIRMKDFRTQMLFVSDVISQFDVARGNTRVSLISNGNTARVEFHLNRYSNVQQMRSAILSVRTEGGIANTHLALETMMTDVFTVKNGYRPGVAHICIVITNGPSSNPFLLRLQSLKAHSAGIYTFAIGVGKLTDVRELKQLASRPIRDYVIEVEGYKAMSQITPQLTSRTCKNARMTDSSVMYSDSGAPQNMHLFQGKIMFGLHGIGPQLRPYVKEFIKSLGGVFDLEQGNVHLGVMENCGQADIELGQFTSKEHFIQMVNNKMDDVGMASFLGHVRQSFVPRAIWSANHKRIVIIIVGADVGDMEQVKLEASRLAGSAEMVVLIGLGGGVSSYGLDDLGSAMTGNTRVYQLPDPSELNTAVFRKVLTYITE